MSGVLRSVWLIAAALAMMPILLFSYRAFGLVELAFWAGALPASAISWRWLKGLPWWPVFLVALLLYACVSILWSPSSRAADALVYIPLVLTGSQLIVHGRMRPELFMWCVFGAVAVLLADAATGNLLRDLVPPPNTALKDAVFTGRGLTLALLLVPAAALISYRTGGWRGGRGMIILAGLAAASTPVMVNGAMLLSGLAAMVVTALRPALGLRLVLAGVGLALAAPFVLAAVLPDAQVLASVTALPESTVHRLIIWRTVLDAWLSGATLFGEGTRASSELFRAAGDITLASGSVLPRVSVHPHNWPIEVLYELGLAGYALLLLAYAAGARALLHARMGRDMAAAIAALVTGAVVVMLLDYSMWSEFMPCALVVGAWALRLGARVRLR